MNEYLYTQIEDREITKEKYTDLRGEYVPTLDAPPFSPLHLRGPRPLRDRIVADVPRVTT